MDEELSRGKMLCLALHQASDSPSSLKEPNTTLPPLYAEFVSGWVLQVLEVGGV